MSPESLPSSADVVFQRSNRQLADSLLKEGVQAVQERAKGMIQRAEIDLGTSPLAQVRPASTPQAVWDKLTPEQRVFKRVRRLSGLFVSAEFAPLFDVRTSLKLLNPDLTEQEREIVVALWSASKWNDRNPTRNEGISYVRDSVREGVPLKPFLSQCLAKNPQVRPEKVAYFTGKSVNADITQFVDSVERKGWEEVRQILNTVNYPVRPTILLGDQDFFTMDACDQWCSAESLARLESEMGQLCATEQQAADEFFGKDRVKIDRWSSFYAVDRSRAQEARVPQDATFEADIQQIGRIPYMQSWGYPQLAKKMGISYDQLVAFIDADIRRTAAQYRVEADVIREQKGMQCWAETAGNPLWPMKISNYDNSGVPPQLFLL